MSNDKSEIFKYAILDKWTMETRPFVEEEEEDRSNDFDSLVEKATEKCTEDGNNYYIVEVKKVIKSDKKPYNVLVKDYEV